MDVSFMRSEFTVFVVDRTLSESQSLVESLKTAGYSDTRFYPTLDSALAVIQHNPPHILLFDFERHEEGAERFLMDLQATSAWDIEPASLCEPADNRSSKNFRDRP